MAENLDIDTILSAIVADFECAWEGIAIVKTEHKSGGNFLFALQAMLLLEVFCRSCAAHEHGKSLQQKFSEFLKSVEPKYFTRLTRPKGYRPKQNGFLLPSDLPMSEEEKREDAPLIAILFDLIRNGLAHQYQQIRVDLEGGKHFCVSLGGAEKGWDLEDALTSERTKDHLRADEESGDLWLTVRPDALFIHLKEAIKSAVTGTVLPPPDYFHRTMPISIEQLRKSLP